MTKKDIIKQEIMGTIRVPTVGSLYGQDLYLSGLVDYAIVDLEKLAALLAKYLDIKIEEEKPQTGYITPKTGNSTNDRMPQKVEILS